VANEKGVAQTVGIYPGGVVGLQYRTMIDRRNNWKVVPKKVIAL